MSVTFTKDATTVTLPDPTPASRIATAKAQALGLTADATRYVYDKGGSTYSVELTFESLSDSEKDDLQSFFDTTVDGAKEMFTYTDPNANAHAGACFINQTLAWTKVAQSVWDVAVTLELTSVGD